MADEPDPKATGDKATGGRVAGPVRQGAPMTPGLKAAVAQAAALNAAAPWIAEARRAERAGDLAGALEALSRGVTAQPQNPVLLTRYAMRLRAAGRFIDSIAVMRRAQSTTPDDRLVLLELGTSLRLDFRVDEALRLHEGLTRRYADDVEVVSAWALDVALAGDPERGVDRAMALVAVHRNRLDLSIVLARILVALGRHREAIQRVREVLGRVPRAYSGWIVLAAAARGAGWDEELAEATANAVKLSERLAQTQHLRGEAAERRGDPDEARWWYREALSTHARHYPSSLALGRLHGRAGEMDAARDRLREAAAVGGWDGRARGTWLRFRMAMGDPGLALDRAESDASRHPYSGLALQIGRIHLDVRKDAAAAVLWLRRAAEHAPDDPRAWRWYARAAVLAGRGEEAVRAERRLIELDV